MFGAFLTGIGGLLARKWLALLLAALVAAVIAGISLYVHGAEKAKGKVLVLEDRLASAEASAVANQVEVENCLLLNQANAEEARLQMERARVAVAEVRRLKLAADQRTGELEHEAETLRAGGLDCPAINADFRRWLRESP